MLNFRSFSSACQAFGGERWAPISWLCMYLLNHAVLCKIEPTWILEHAFVQPTICVFFYNYNSLLSLKGEGFMRPRWLLIAIKLILFAFLGLLLREIKEFWRSALVLSIILYPTDIGLSGNSSSVVAELTDRRELFNGVENAIMELGIKLILHYEYNGSMPAIFEYEFLSSCNSGLEKVWELKPLVNGKDIMNILQLKSGGPVVKEWVCLSTLLVSDSMKPLLISQPTYWFCCLSLQQQKLLEWQLAHPSGSSEECIDWMEQSQSKRPRME